MQNTPGMLLCDIQFLRGKTILLLDPVVPNLNASAREHRAVLARCGGTSA
jgi:hypothetical protein